MTIFHSQIYPYLIPLLLPFAQIALTCSVNTILAVAAERLVSIYRYVLWIYGYILKRNYCSRPKTEVPKMMSWFVPFSILILSVILNFNRFLEYKTEVFLKLCIFNEFIDIFIQNIIAQIPFSINVEGALLIGVNSTTRENIWQWTLVMPTSLRKDTLYSKVGNKRLTKYYHYGILGVRVSFNPSQHHSFCCYHLFQLAHLSKDQTKHIITSLLD